MKLKIIFLGKKGLSFSKEGVEYYLKKINRFLNTELITIDPSKFPEGKEGERAFKKSINPNGPLWLFDERGKEFDSKSFSKFLTKLLEGGTKEVVFAVGADSGFPKIFTESAQGTISLSKMTLNHNIARLAAVEQIYRALDIANGGPYHRE